MESIGFKEWAIVCEALGCGKQSIILRKGGIANSGKIDIRYFAAVESSQMVTAWPMAEALEPFHILQADVGPRTVRLRQ